MSCGGGGEGALGLDNGIGFNIGSPNNKYQLSHNNEYATYTCTCNEKLISIHNILHTVLVVCFKDVKNST